jgi:mono/diheme cytochrome c family protein
MQGRPFLIKQLFILSIPMLATACVTDRDASALSGRAADGRAFAEANCASCHALDDGVSPNPSAPSLRRAAHSLPTPMLAGSLEAGIQIGHTAQMPVFVFEEENIANLLAYFEILRSED